MKEIEIEEMKALQLEMLQKIDHFCKEKGIKYYLTAGTLIGAVRHKGYIPWDDDIDIMMLRKDYDKFLRSFNGSVKYLVVGAPELDWNYYAPYANVYDERTLLIEKEISHRGQEIGVKIDVFPFDDLPQSEIVYTLTRRFSNALNIIRHFGSPSQMDRSVKIKKIVNSFFPYRIVQRLIHIIATSKIGGESNDVFLRTFDITKPMRADKNWFGQGKYVPFEQYYFPIPDNADEYLKIRYGNYMKLPTEEERVPHHGFKAYWKE